MRKYFIVSLIQNGILGGGIVADDDAITYRSGKVTIPQEYRHLVMKYEDICEVTPGWLFVLPTVTVKMQNGRAYRFAVFFSRQRFIKAIQDKKVDASNENH